ncbi:MAG TPA: FHA domain-containing protein [Lacipirellulaceae bacterium]|nr:FHA domain-containing protein [Lacipirellulaceae bacterium]
MTSPLLQMAYHELLGIHPAEQPPDHYRLLALCRFESNPVAIANAVDCRMSFVRRLAAGRYEEAAEEILGRLAEARVILLNAQCKEHYDSQLRQASSPAEARDDASSAAGNQWVIGSAMACDHVIQEQYVSKQHCGLIAQGDRVQIEDLNSRNGTFVNGRRIHEATMLAPGDRVTLGRKTVLNWSQLPFVNAGAPETSIMHSTVLPAASA